MNNYIEKVKENQLYFLIGLIILAGIVVLILFLTGIIKPKCNETVEECIEQECTPETIQNMQQLLSEVSSFEDIDKNKSIQECVNFIKCVCTKCKDCKENDDIKRDCDMIGGNYNTICEELINNSLSLLDEVVIN